MGYCLCFSENRRCNIINLLKGKKLNVLLKTSPKLWVQRVLSSVKSKEQIMLMLSNFSLWLKAVYFFSIKFINQV